MRYITLGIRDTIYIISDAHRHVDVKWTGQNKGKFTKSNCGCFSGSRFVRRSLRYIEDGTMYVKWDIRLWYENY